MKITLDRPDKRNAVDLATLRLLLDAQREARERRARVVVLTGTAPAFCSGADLDGVELGEFTETLLAVLGGFADLPAITIAAVDGPALGAGTQLAIACDLRMASTSSRFGVPASKLGLAVDRWTVVRLGHEAGWSTARAMLLTGDPVEADRLVGSLVHRTGDLAAAMQWASELATRAPLTVVAHKLALESSAGVGAARIVTDDEVEAARLAAWSSADADEGRRAFREKRPPSFRGE